MALSGIKMALEIRTELLAMRGNLSRVGEDQQYVEALQLDEKLKPYTGSEKHNFASIRQEFAKDMNLLQDATAAWFKASFWKGMIAKTGDDTLCAIAESAINAIVICMEEGLGHQSFIPRTLQRVSLQDPVKTAISQYYFFVLSQIVAAANEEYKKSDQRLTGLRKVLTSALSLSSVTAGRARTTFIKHTEKMMRFVETYQKKLAMIAEQQTYKDRLNDLKRSARQTINSIVENLIIAGTAMQVPILNIERFILARADDDSFYGEFLRTPMGKLLHEFCLHPDVLPVISSEHDKPQDRPKSIVFDHLSKEVPTMRLALTHRAQPFISREEEVKFKQDPLYSVFQAGKSLQDTSFFLGWGNPSIFFGIGERAEASEFSTALLNALFDILDQTRHLCRVHQLIEQSRSGVGLLGDFFIRKSAFVLLIDLIQEVTAQLGRNLSISCARFFDIVRGLPTLLEDQKRGEGSHYDRLISNHAALRLGHDETQTHIQALDAHVKELAKRTAAITYGRIQEEMMALQGIAAHFCDVGDKIGLEQSSTIYSVRALLDGSADPQKWARPSVGLPSSPAWLPPAFEPVQASYYGLIPVDEGARGNCFFLTIAKQIQQRCSEKMQPILDLFPGVEPHRALRLFVVGAISLLKETGWPELDDVLAAFTHEKIFKLERDGKFARDLVIPFMAITLGVTITIVTNRLVKGVLQPPFKYSAGEKKLYCLYLNDNHYQSLEGIVDPTLDIVASLAGDGVHRALDNPAAIRGAYDRNILPFLIDPTEEDAFEGIEVSSPQRIVFYYANFEDHASSSGSPSKGSDSASGSRSEISLGKKSAVSTPSDLKIPGGASPKVKLAFILFNTKLGKSLDALAVMNASNVDEPNISRVDSVKGMFSAESGAKNEIRLAAKIALRDFLRSSSRSPPISVLKEGGKAGEREALTSDHFNACSFEELNELADLVIRVCEAGDKQALGRRLYAYIQAAFSDIERYREKPARDPYPKEAVSVSGGSTRSLPKSSSSRDGFKTPPPKGVASSPTMPSVSEGSPFPVELPVDPRDVIDFPSVIQSARAGYSVTDVKNESCVEGKKLETDLSGETGVLLPLEEKTARFVKYILFNAGNRTIGSSLRVRILSKICARKDMYPFITEAMSGTSLDIILMTLRDIILLHMGLQPNQHEHPDISAGLLLDFMRIFVFENLKYATERASWEYLKNWKVKGKGERIRSVVKGVMTAQIEHAPHGGPVSLMKVLKDRPLDHNGILLGLQAEMRKAYAGKEVQHGSIYEVMGRNAGVFFPEYKKMRELFFGTGCGILFMSDIPTERSIDHLPIKSAYIRVGADQLYYVSKPPAAKFGAVENVTMDKCREFDGKVERPVGEFRILRSEELGEIAKLDIKKHLAETLEKPKGKSGKADAENLDHAPMRGHSVGGSEQMSTAGFGVM